MNRRIALIVAVLIGVVLAAMVLFRSTPPQATIPTSRLAFDRPASWHEADRARVLDPAWAEEQKQLYPNDAAFIDAMVEAFRTGRIQYSAWIDLDGDLTRADGWVEASVVSRAVAPAGLADEARASVTRQPVSVRPGTNAVTASLPIGPAVRLDWSFDLALAEGGSEVVSVRSYWLVDGSSLIVIQLTTYGDHPEVVANFDAVAATFRWAP